jgi:hypothetical protein
MRALYALLLLAACSEPQASAPRALEWGLDESTPDPATNIATIGAPAMCRDDERAVVTYQGASVTACEPVSPPTAP